MKNAVVFNSISGNTEQIANAIKETIGDVGYFGKPSDEALEADVIYVGSWVMAFSCTPDIKEFLAKLNGKKVFVFATAGYGSTPEFFAPIIASIKENVNSSNEIIGEFICQGKVADKKLEAIKADAAKYASMKDELDKSAAHPNADDISALKSKLA